MVEVFAWGARVGAVAWNPVKCAGAFEYDPDWLRGGFELSPFTVPLQSGVVVFPELAGSWFQGVPGLLADSLPRAFGLGLVRRWLRCHGDDDVLSPVAQLKFVGSSGPGALEFRPDRRPNRPARDVSIDDLAASARALHDAGGSAAALDETRLAELLAAADLGSDRPRARVDWRAPPGPARPRRNESPEPGGNWLITFANDDVGGRVEYAYSLMAAEAGVAVPMCRLFVDLTGRAHFMSRRFGRTVGGQTHVQTLAALRHLDPDSAADHSYEQALSTAQALGVGAGGVGQLYTRMVFNVCAANHKVTTARIAFMMDPTGVWALAPALDLTWVPSPTRSHQMTVNGTTTDITREDLSAVGRRFGIRGAGGIIDTVTSVVAAWKQYAAYAEVPPATQTEVGATHRIRL